MNSICDPENGTWQWRRRRGAGGEQGANCRGCPRGRSKVVAAVGLTLAAVVIWLVQAAAARKRSMFTGMIIRSSKIVYKSKFTSGPRASVDLEPLNLVIQVQNAWIWATPEPQDLTGAVQRFWE